MPQTEYLAVFLDKSLSNRRLSRSTLDVFNLRNEKLSPIYQSSPGLYCPHMRSLESVQSDGLRPKSILVKKPPQEELDTKATKPLEEKEEKRSSFSIGLELQFTTFILLSFMLIIVIPLSMIIMGSIYVNSCPRQLMIPVFLIVSGSSFLASILLLRKLSKRNDTEFDRSCYKSTFTSSVLFQVVWFVAGCIWIYGTREIEYDLEDSPFYCNKTLYQYSFWLLNSLFITSVLSVFLFAIFVFVRKEKNSDFPTKI